MEEFVLWKQKYIHHLELQRGLRQNSLRAIQKDLEQFLSYIEDCQEKEFTVLAMKSYFFSLQEKYAASTVHRKLSSIKVFLRFLKEENIVREDFSLYFTKVRKEEDRSEEHTSELQSRQYLVCRLLLEKKNKISFFNYLLTCYLSLSTTRQPPTPPLLIFLSLHSTRTLTVMSTCSRSCC